MTDPKKHWATIDAICDEFEREFQSDPKVRMEPVLDRLENESRSASLFCELANLELELRRSNGESPRLSEYLQRFPDQSDVLDEVFAGASQTKSPGAGGDTIPTDLVEKRHIPKETLATISKHAATFLRTFARTTRLES